MSNAQKMSWDYAHQMANTLVDLLKPACERIEIAGSIRRMKDEVGDIEIVCKPAIYNGPDTQFCSVNHLETAIEILLLEGTLEKRVAGGKTAWGERAKRAVFFKGKNYAAVDIFSVLPPAQWPVIYAIRTGPWQFNRLLVTNERVGGACPADLKVAGGQVWYIGDCEYAESLALMPSSKFIKVAEENGARTRPIEDERHFFEILGVPYLEPQERTEDRLRSWLNSRGARDIMSEHEEAIRRNKGVE